MYRERVFRCSVAAAAAMLFAACGVGSGQSPQANVGAGGFTQSSSPAPATVGTAAANPDTEAPVSLQLSTSGSVGGWDLAVSGARVYAAWSEQLAEGNVVHFRVSEQEGATFAPLQQLTEPAPGIELRRVVASGESVYVLWTQPSPESGSQLWVRASTDGGATFGPAQQVPLSGLDAVAAEGSSLYVLDSVTGDELADFRFVASHDGGATWSQAQTVNQNGRYGDVSMLARGGHVSLLWDDGGTNDEPTLFFRESADGGATFGPILLAADGARSIGSAKMVLQGAALHLVWSQCTGSGVRRTCQIDYRMQPGEGQPLGPLQVLAPTADRWGVTDIAADADTLHVVWLRGTATQSDIVYRRSADGGNTFLPEQNLTEAPAWRVFPQVAAGERSAYVTWGVSGESGTSYRFLQGEASGTAFGREELLSAAFNVSSPKVAATPNHFHSLRVEGDYGARVLKYWRR